MRATGLRRWRGASRGGVEQKTRRSSRNF